MVTQKALSKSAKRNHKSDISNPSVELAPKQKRSSSKKKLDLLTKSQTTSDLKSSIQVKGSAAVNSQNSKNLNSSYMKTQSKAKKGAAITSRKNSSGVSSRLSSTILGQNGVGSAGETVCREVACEGLGTSGGYCRLHYIKNWKKIKRKEVILREKKLNQYIEELVAKYPDKYIEAIRQDLASDKDFAKVIYDLDLDEAVDDFDAEGGDSVDSLIDTIKRDFDDESDAF